jgi:hypothetical protein
MNVVAALLGFFVLRPVIKSRLAPAADLERGRSSADHRVRRVA